MSRASKLTIIALMLIIPVGAHLVGQQKKYCQRGESCWPTAADVSALAAALDPKASRVLKWDGAGTPRVCSVPQGSPGDQPLYGWGVPGLDALDSDPKFNKSDLCFSAQGEIRPICLGSLRNNPQERWSPGFVVWALKAAHVRAAIHFAVAHNLCISVVGSGHDFLNRHSCSDGVLIRTTLMKGIEWDLDDKKGFGNADGNVKYGAGIVFSEAHKSASDNDRFVSSGWGITVGIVGWSIGGGHGPFSNTKGLGVDNVLEVEVVVADGSIITANSKNNTDLFWAIRGGGGSTWGVITALTVKAHKIPDDHFSVFIDNRVGNFCDAGMGTLNTLIDEYQKWALNLDNKWSGITFFRPGYTGKPTDCNGTWSVFRQYSFQGSTSAQANVTWASLTSIPAQYQTATNYANWWDNAVNYELERITPWAWGPDGVPSVLVNRSMVADGSLANVMKKRMRNCQTSRNCGQQALYQDVTGARDSPQDPNVSIAPGFRKAMLHFLGNFGKQESDIYYALGENSYFGESAYWSNGDSWKQRYWGKNYDILLKIKQKWDPNNVFWCRHCVGSDL